MWGFLSDADILFNNRSTGRVYRGVSNTASSIRYALFTGVRVNGFKPQVEPFRPYHNQV